MVFLDINSIIPEASVCIDCVAVESLMVKKTQNPPARVLTAIFGGRVADKLGAAVDVNPRAIGVNSTCFNVNSGRTCAIFD